MWGVWRRGRRKSAGSPERPRAWLPAARPGSWYPSLNILPDICPSLGRGVPPAGIRSAGVFRKRQNAGMARSMHIVTLIGSETSPLDPALVSSLQTAWGGGEAVWLSPDEAAEFPVGAVPGNVDQVRGDIEGMRVDLNVLPARNRRKRLLLADMDSTMIGQECIDELAAETGVGEHVAGITARAMNGEL